MTATRTPFSSSSSVNTRPISGLTPSTLQRFGRRGHEPRTVLVAHVKPDHHKAARIGIRQRTNQHRIDGAEHRGNPADPERECRDRDGRKSTVAPHLSCSVAHVTCELFEPRPAPLSANILLYQSGVAKDPVGSILSGFFGL